MLAYVDYYRGMLQRHAVTLGESEGGDLAYEAFFANPAGRTSRAGFLGALVPLVAAAALYFFLVKGRNGEWVLATLLFPATILHVRRLHDMGQSAWLLLVPTVLNVTAIWLHMFNRSPEFRPTITVAALVVSAAFLLWASLGRGASQPNRFGAPAAA